MYRKQQSQMMVSPGSGRHPSATGCCRSGFGPPPLVIVSCLLAAMVISISAAQQLQQSSHASSRPLLGSLASTSPASANEIPAGRGTGGVSLHSWPTRQQELLDEANDAQLLRAVQQSMDEWTRSHDRKQQAEQLERREQRRRKRRRRAAAPASAATATSGASGQAEKSVCYGDLGCFEDSGPFGYLDMLPSPPEEINTRFMFYSTKNRSDNPLFEIPYLNISDAWRDLQQAAQQSTTTTAAPQPSSPTSSSSKRWHALKTFPGLEHSSVRIIVHGFGSACPHVWIYELRTALMAVEDCVVICVDWENGANFPNYVRAAANTRLVGKQLAMFLRGLQQYKQLDLNRVHLIGFSLGAHVSGFAGAELPGLSRITGLDPAGPLFESQHPKARLDSSDATFVDVIHSNGENLILGGLGSWQPMGDVDFYPNGGRVQHGCSNLFVGAVTDFIWSPAAAVEGRSLCNHRRAYKFFIDSVAPRCLFPAFPCANYDDFLLGQCFPCDTSPANADASLTTLAPPTNPLNAPGARCGNMGYYADRSTGRGQLYLITREEEPFCAHQFTIEIHSPPNDLPLRTLGKLEAVLTGDGQLNETFGITEKDDSEFYAGERVSRILVPHPALGFPQAITLRYKSYSGWLTKGLPQWTVHKVVLADSFGGRRSLCRSAIALYSDRPVYLRLQPGDCEPPEPLELDADGGDGDADGDGYSTTTASTTTQSATESELPTTTTTTPMDMTQILRDKKEIIQLGKSYPIQVNAPALIAESSDNDNLIDAPVGSKTQLLQQQQQHELNVKRYVRTGEPESNSASESGRSITVESDTLPPLRLQLGLQALQARRHEEPLLRSTTLRGSAADTTKAPTPAVVPKHSTSAPSTSASSQTSSTAATESARPRENSVFTIQLFPFRLGELIERAERYARETLLPLISEQAPRIFRFGETPAASDQAAATGTRNARHLKYIPAASASTGSLMTGERLSALASEDGDQPIRQQRRRIDLPPQMDASGRIELADFSGAGRQRPRVAADELPGQSRQTRPMPANLLRPQTAGSVGDLSSGRQMDAAVREEAGDRASVYYTNDVLSLGEELVRIALPTYRPESTTQTAPTTTTTTTTKKPNVMIVTAIPIPLSAADGV